MPQVSRNPISSQVASRMFDVFIKSLIQINNKSEAKALAGDLFTTTEKIMLAKRLSIAYLLLKGFQYREIRDLLKVSTTTVGSIKSSFSSIRSDIFNNILLALTTVKR